MIKCLLMDDHGSTVKQIRIVVFLLVMVIVGCPLSHAQFGQPSFGASNYYGIGLGLGGSYVSNGLWWVQNRCPWGSKGYRSPSQYQCGTFTCPSMWFGTTTYQCAPPTLYSNALQQCVHPASLAGSCRGSRYRHII